MVVSIFIKTEHTKGLFPEISYKKCRDIFISPFTLSPTFYVCLRVCLSVCMYVCLYVISVCLSPSLSLLDSHMTPIYWDIVVFAFQTQRIQRLFVKNNYIDTS